MPANLEKSAIAIGLEKVSFHTNPKFLSVMPKNVQTSTQFHSHTSKVQHKIIQAKLQQYVNIELLDVQAGFRKDQIVNICWIIGKARELKKKKSTSASLTMLKALIVWITTNWKILHEMGIPEYLTCLL